MVVAFCCRLGSLGSRLEDGVWHTGCFFMEKHWDQCPVEGWREEGGKGRRRADLRAALAHSTGGCGVKMAHQSFTALG